jgi:HEAT repeat protein
VGDPTLRFTNGEDLSDKNSLQSKLNYNLAVNSKNQKVWEDYLKTENPVIQAVAIKKLSALNIPGFSGRLLEIFKNSKFNSVRMEALKRLFDYGDENMVIAIELGIEDSFELVRRNAARFAGYSGDSRLIKPLVKTMLFSGESQRVQYAAQNSVLMFNIGDVIKEVSAQISASNLINGAQIESDITKFLLSEQKRQEKALATIVNKEAKPEDRISAIRNLRNYNNHKQVDKLLEVISDSSDNIKTRIALAEALGWFNLSIKKNMIVNTLEKLLIKENEDKTLKGEINQSLIRLK